MPSPVGAVLSLVTKGWPLLVKYGPKALGALTVLTRFAADNPAIPTWFRKRLQDLPKRLSDVQKRSGDAARIRGTLEVVRDVARDAQAADEQVDGAGYVVRADRIERGVKLAETLDGQERKLALRRLKTDTDGLLAEVLEAVSGRRPPAPAAATGAQGAPTAEEPAAPAAEPESGTAAAAGPTEAEPAAESSRSEAGTGA